MTASEARISGAATGGDGPTPADRPAAAIGLGVLIVNYRTPELAMASARAAARSANHFKDLRVIVVDGGSADGSDARIAQALAAEPDPAIAALPLPVNGGFAFANNRGIVALRDGVGGGGGGGGGSGGLPDLIALINPDARVRPGALEAMAALLAREPGAGAVGARLEHEDGRAQASAFNFPSLRGEFARGAQTGAIDRLLRVPAISLFPDRAIEVPWVTGAAVMFRTQALRETGLFDEGFFLYFEETDLMRRVRAAGWQVWHEPAARVVHHGGVATQIRDPETGKVARARPMPRYWFESRRRYFALAGGRGYALASSLAWLGGRAIWHLRALVGKVAADQPANLTRDFLRHSFWARPVDARDAALSADAPAPALPAWQRAR